MPSPRSNNVSHRFLAPGLLGAGCLALAGGLMRLGAATVPSAPLPGATNLPAGPLPPAAPPLTEITFPLVRIFGALAIVLALFVGGAWLLRNWQVLAAKRAGRPARLRLLEARSLGGRHVLYVVAYDRQRLLVGASPNGLNLIDRLPSAEDDEPSGSEPASSFSEALRRLLPGS